MSNYSKEEILRFLDLFEQVPATFPEEKRNSVQKLREGVIADDERTITMVIKMLGTWLNIVTQVKSSISEEQNTS